MISCNHTGYYDPSCDLCRAKGGEVLDMPDFLRNPAALIDELRAELAAKDERHHETVLALSAEIDARIKAEAGNAQLEDLIVHMQEKVQRLEAALGMDTAWPLYDVLGTLAEAVEHLLSTHGCDTHGHENFRRAAIRAREIRAALEPKP